MIALIDCRASKISHTSLQKCGFDTFLIPPSPLLQAGVASHTDMLIFIGFGRLFCHASYYESNKDLIEYIAQKGNLNLSLSDEEWSHNYPHDVLFNACLVGNKLICNKKTVSKNILRTAFENNCLIIDVPQGYTKCSICVVSDNAIITADRSIAKACQNSSMDVLLISEGHIYLPPYSFGFIGGTSGLCGDTVFFCGSLEKHPDATKIKAFCQKYGKQTFSLSDDTLLDIGSILFIGE